MEEGIILVPGDIGVSFYFSPIVNKNLLEVGLFLFLFHCFFILALSLFFSNLVLLHCFFL